MGYTLHRLLNVMGNIGYTLHRLLNVMGTVGYTLHRLLNVMGNIGYTLHLLNITGSNLVTHGQLLCKEISDANIRT